MKKSGFAIASAVLCAASAALAAPPPDGTYKFSFNKDAPKFLMFATGDWIAPGNPGDSWRQDVTFGSVGVLGDFRSWDTSAHATPYFVGGATLRAKIVFEKSTSGVIDLGLASGDVLVVAHMEFSAGSAVDEATCKTDSFEFKLFGSFTDGHDTDPFAIPALSGSDEQKCNGWSGTINGLLKLGVADSVVRLDKMTVTYDP